MRTERVAAIWALLTELVALPARMSPAVVRGLARGIECGNFQEATEALRAEIKECSKQQRLELEGTLRTLAPTYKRALG